MVLSGGGSRYVPSDTGKWPRASMPGSGGRVRVAPVPSPCIGARCLGPASVASWASRLVAWAFAVLRILRGVSADVQSGTRGMREKRAFYLALSLMNLNIAGTLVHWQRWNRGPMLCPFLHFQPPLPFPPTSSIADVGSEGYIFCTSPHPTQSAPPLACRASLSPMPPLIFSCALTSGCAKLGTLLPPMWSWVGWLTDDQHPGERVPLGSASPLFVFLWLFWGRWARARSDGRHWRHSTVGL